MQVQCRPGSFSTPIQQKNIAEMVAITVNADRYEGMPYLVDDKDLTRWVVDIGNDWRITFVDDRSFEIWHRYNSTLATGALATWIAYRLGGTVK